MENGFPRAVHSPHGGTANYCDLPFPFLGLSLVGASARCPPTHVAMHVSFDLYGGASPSTSPSGTVPSAFGSLAYRKYMSWLCVSNSVIIL